MSIEQQLRDQNWRAISKQLTTYAWRHTGKRSWENAEDLAQQAIADAYAKPDAWDPDKEPLLKNLCRRVYGLATNSWRHKRNSFEVSMQTALKRYGVRHDDGGRREIDVASGEDGSDELLDQRRLAESFRQRIMQRFAGDEPAVTLVSLWLKGVDSPQAQAEASGLTPAQIKDARRRVFRHAEAVSKELAFELDYEDDASIDASETTT